MKAQAFIKVLLHRLVREEGGVGVSISSIILAQSKVPYTSNGKVGTEDDSLLPSTILVTVKGVFSPPPPLGK